MFTGRERGSNSFSFSLFSRSLYPSRRGNGRVRRSRSFLPTEETDRVPRSKKGKEHRRLGESEKELGEKTRRGFVSFRFGSKYARFSFFFFFLSSREVFFEEGGGRVRDREVSDSCSRREWTRQRSSEIRDKREGGRKRGKKYALLEYFWRTNVRENGNCSASRYSLFFTRRKGRRVLVPRWFTIAE